MSLANYSNQITFCENHYKSPKNRPIGNKFSDFLNLELYRIGNFEFEKTDFWHGSIFPSRIDPNFLRIQTLALDKFRWLVA